MVLQAPSVYIDHWAVMDFAALAHEAKAVYDFIQNGSGTLVFSWANLLEFAAASKNDFAAADRRGSPKRYQSAA